MIRPETSSSSSSSARPQNIEEAGHPRFIKTIHPSKSSSRRSGSHASPVTSLGMAYHRAHEHSGGFQPPAHFESQLEPFPRLDSSEPSTDLESEDQCFEMRALPPASVRAVPPHPPRALPPRPIRGMLGIEDDQMTIVPSSISSSRRQSMLSQQTTNRSSVQGGGALTIQQLEASPRHKEIQRQWIHPAALPVHRLDKGKGVIGNQPPPAGSMNAASGAGAGAGARAGHADSSDGSASSGADCALKTVVSGCLRACCGR